MKVDFFIVGAPKSATTSLFNYLSQHELSTEIEFYSTCCVFIHCTSWQ